MRSTSIALLLFAAMSGLSSAQTVTLGTGTLVNVSNGYPAPYGNYFWGSRHQFLITAAELTAAGGAPGPVISLGFSVAAAASQPHLNFDIRMGHTTQTVMTNWESGLTWVFNAAAVNPAVGWSTHTFCTPFVWDGVSNVIVETCHQNTGFATNAGVNQTAGTFNQSKWFRQDALGTCTNAGQSGVSVNRPNMQLTFGTPAPIEYQSNSAGASLTMGTAATNGCIAPIYTQQAYSCGATLVGATGNINFSSTALGLPWDVVISSTNLVAVSGGALVIPAGIINLDLSQPFGFVNGFFGSNLPNFTFPGVNSASISWGYSIASNVNSTMQAMAINPTAPGGASLSQAVEYHCVLNVNGVPTTPGPVSDDTGVTVSFGAPQVCWPSITMYGTVFTQMQVISNGRVMFQPAINTDMSPTIAEAQLATVGPFVGYWTDLNPALSATATITASQPAPGIIRVDYANVPYDTDAGAMNSFGLQFDTLTGSVQIDGLTGIVANPQTVLSALYDSAFLGMSRGSGATDGGLTTFASGTSGVALSPTAMWYDWYGAVAGGAGRVGSLTSGTLNAIVFTPSATIVPNYDWMGF